MEIWKTVNEKGYQVSNYGRVKGIKGKILKPKPNKKGYLYNYLGDKTQSVHTLVWDSFGSPPRDGHKLQVDHKDGDKSHNHINNLQLLSNQENCAKHHKKKRDKVLSAYRKGFFDCYNLFVKNKKDDVRVTNTKDFDIYTTC